EAVLCTHYLPLEALAQMKKQAASKKKKNASAGAKSPAGASIGAIGKPDAEGRRLGPLVVSIVTDFEAHALWMAPCVDLYCVAAPETKARLIARGAEPANVEATGIPISARCSAKTDPKAVRKSLGLRD